MLKNADFGCWKAARTYLHGRIEAQWHVCEQQDGKQVVSFSTKLNKNEKRESGHIPDTSEASTARNDSNLARETTRSRTLIEVVADTIETLKRRSIGLLLLFVFCLCHIEKGQSGGRVCSAEREKKEGRCLCDVQKVRGDRKELPPGSTSVQRKAGAQADFPTLLGSWNFRAWLEIQDFVAPARDSGSSRTAACMVRLHRYRHKKGRLDLTKEGNLRGRRSERCESVQRDRLQSMMQGEDGR